MSAFCPRADNLSTTGTPSSASRSGPSLSRSASPLSSCPHDLKGPDLNSFAERWVKSVKEECLSTLILFGERSLRHALKDYVEHHHRERNHQGKDNLLLFPREGQTNTADGAIRCRERLGGLLKFYYRKAA